MFGKISFIILLVIFIVLAIMFDWFGSRDLFQKGVDGAQVAVEKIESAGDKVNQAIETINEEEKR
ncbi:hypothetical protein [Thiomicrorhabdus chilensis]|uniref:hypothetical protein n=1 Tax=Thiomicrorhabdus chilensis TaxID=63656 RepID=UPI00040EC387|nr:hypothetical protein [Thiomicrorhabdus chilensis]